MLTTTRRGARRLARTGRTLWVGSLLSYRALFNWARPTMFVATLLVAPVMQMIFFVHLGRHVGVADDQFYVVGNVVQGCSTACLFGCTMAIANERRYGTLGVVLLVPGARLLQWTCRVLPYIANGMLVSVVVFTAGDALFGLQLTVAQTLALLLVVAVASFSCCGLGLVLGALGLRFRDVFLLSNIASVVLLLLSGGNVPHSALPRWLAGVGDGLPLGNAVRAARTVAAGGSAASAGGALATELLLGAGYVALAAVMLRLFEHATRRRGAVEDL